MYFKKTDTVSCILSCQCSKDYGTGNLDSKPPNYNQQLKSPPALSISLYNLLFQAAVGSLWSFYSLTFGGSCPWCHWSQCGCPWPAARANPAFVLMRVHIQTNMHKKRLKFWNAKSVHLATNPNINTSERPLPVWNFYLCRGLVECLASSVKHQLLQRLRVAWSFSHNCP